MSDGSIEVAGEAAMGDTAPELVNPSIGNALQFYLCLLVFPCLVVAATYGGWFLILPYLYIVVSDALIEVFGKDESNLDDTNMSGAMLGWYTTPVYLWTIGWLATWIYSMYQMLVAGDLVLWESLVLLFGLLYIGQTVFIVGHELIHRRTAIERRIGDFLLTSLSYISYAEAHLYIHHAKVGTPEDSSSPPRGMSFWTYLGREFVGGLGANFRVTKEHLKDRNHGFWHFSNPYWRYAILLAFWYGLAVYWGGAWIALIYLVLGIFSFISNKLVDYVQHYGLRRVFLPSGRYESVASKHAWSIAFRISDKLFFNSQRHADHHLRESRHYALLRYIDGKRSPQFPGSYMKVIGATLTPKKWFALMDPLVDEWREKINPEVKNWQAYDSKVTLAKPESFSVIDEIYSKAPLVSAWMEESHDLLDGLNKAEFQNLVLPIGFSSDPKFETIARKGLAIVYWTHELDREEMRKQLEEIPVQDAAEAVDITRNWMNDKAFQVGIHVMRESLTVADAQIALTNVADAAIQHVLRNVLIDVGEPRYGGAVVLAYGTLAKREIVPKSPIELTYLYDDDSAASCRKVGAKFVRMMRRLCKGNLLFAEDRKKSSRFYVQSLSELQSFHTVNETPEALLHLTATEVVDTIGASGFEYRIKVAIHQILMDAYAGEELKNQLSEIRDIDSNSEYLREDILDVAAANHENLSRKLQLTRPKEFVELETTGSVAVCELARDLLDLDTTELDAHLKSSKLWRDLRGIRGLLVGEDEFLQQSSQEVREILARSCGQESWQELEAMLQEEIQATNGRIESLNTQLSAA